MTVACDITIGFGVTGNSLAFCGGGWAQSEPEFTWSIGTESDLLLSQQKVAEEYVLTLDVVPFVHPPELPSQRLIVSVNDIVVGSTELSRPTLLGYRIPGEFARGADRMVIALQHPDAARPSDFSDIGDSRQLAFAFSEVKLYRITRPTGVGAIMLPAGLMLGSTCSRASGTRGHANLADWVLTRTGLTIPQIALQFESLGENCEFGLFQRRCDSEPLGLLRFSSTFMRNLIRGIDTGFAGLGEVDDIEPRLEGEGRKEYMIHEKKYGLVYHTFVFEGQRSIWLMREQEAARLKFLRRKFMEELEAAGKIFVYQFGSAVSEEEILPLHMALNRHSDATLLWVVPAERDRPPGTVEVLMPGLLRGYIDRFAPGDNAHDLSFDGWLRVCTNAVALTKLWRPMVSDIDPRPNAANDDGLGPRAGPGKAPSSGKA